MTKIVSLKELAALRTKGKANRIIQRAIDTKPNNGKLKRGQMEVVRRVANRLSEEMSEVAKEISKANRYGYLAEHNDSGEVYVDRILDEAQDVIDNIIALRKVLKTVKKEQDRLKKQADLKIKEAQKKAKKQIKEDKKSKAKSKTKAKKSKG